MISKTYIAENLRQLDAAFRKARSQKYAVYFSKLAILELCGWIEMSMDDLILRHSKRKIKDAENQSHVEKKIVKRTYGFEYQRHFRQMLIELVGLVTCEKVDSEIDPALHTILLAELETLKTVRNQLAHTYLKDKPVTYKIDAPSVTQQRLHHVYLALKEYEKCLRAL